MTRLCNGSTLVPRIKPLIFSQGKQLCIFSAFHCSKVDLLCYKGCVGLTLPSESLKKQMRIADSGQQLGQSFGVVELLQPFFGRPTSGKFNLRGNLTFPTSTFRSWGYLSKEHHKDSRREPSCCYKTTRFSCFLIGYADEKPSFRNYESELIWVWTHANWPNMFVDYKLNSRKVFKGSWVP